MKYRSDLMSPPKYASWSKYNYSGIDPRGLAFDIDGVVADTMAVFVELVQTRLSLTHFSKEQLIRYNLHECVPAPKEVIDEILYLTLGDHYTKKIPSCPGAREVLEHLGRYVPLRFVTARVWPDSISQWLQDLLPGVNPENIQVVATGDPAIKSRVLRDMGIRVFIEDRPDTCYQLRDQGFNVIVFDQPWNRNACEFPRISDFKELEEQIDWEIIAPGEKGA